MARCGRGLIRRGYTLVELLIATTLTLVMMGGVAAVFGTIGTSVSASRAGLETADALRAAAQRLQTDLDGVTASINPPAKPEDNRKYFEYTEGGAIGWSAPGEVARNTDNIPDTPDSTVGDNDDMLMFTTRSKAEPFLGRTLVKRGVERTSRPRRPPRGKRTTMPAPARNS